MKANQSLEQRLAAFPKLHSRLEQLVSIAENADGQLVLADEVEDRVTEEIQALAREVMQSWAEQENERQAEQSRRAETRLHKNGKKNCTGIPAMDALK